MSLTSLCWPTDFNPILLTHFFQFQAVAGLAGATLSSVLLEKLKSFGLFIFCSVLSLICKYSDKYCMSGGFH